MRINFTKMNGCGNDFIIIDNRRKIFPEEDLSNFARKVCLRRKSLGADGILLLENSAQYGFKMRLFNSDGSEGEMCGNGARCIAQYAFEEGIVESDMVFETIAGPIDARVREQNVEIKVPDINSTEIIRNRHITIDGKNFIYTYLFLGVPHCVIFLKETLSEEVLFQIGRKIRFNKEYFPVGTNVNFVEIQQDNKLLVKTYERGVEEITLSCGTGSLSSALVYSLEKDKKPPFIIKTKGGDLTIGFIREGSLIKNITLAGKVKMVARGELLPQSYHDD